MIYTKEELKDKMKHLPGYTLKMYYDTWRGSLDFIKNQEIKEELQIYISVVEELLYPDKNLKILLRD